MHIIGTAGHVDHGKTLLIKALTGIDTDRLPEEKKRGLTIDLGFAHFKSSSGADIGVVDVPGHERFIRNMTAGAWGIDLALLVTAADDGWMYQTENHLRVLTAMDITNIIAVITKSDIADEKRISELKEDVQARIFDATGFVPPAAAVSALKGSGMAELKKLISEKLTQAPQQDIPQKTRPLLWVDRAFKISGAGLVVTGSLREGSIKRNDSLLILPEGKEVRVRGVQTYDTETEKAEPSCRTALNLSGADASKVKRGCCLTTKENGFTAEKEFIIKLGKRFNSVRNHSETEFATGTAHSIGTIHFLKSKSGDEKLCARVVLEEPIPLRFGQPVVIIQKGGSLITGSGKIIWLGETKREQRIIISAAVTEDEFPDRERIMLAVYGWVKTGDKWKISSNKQLELTKELKKLISASGGIKKEELAGKLEAPEEVINIIIKGLVSSGKFTEQGGSIMLKDSSASQVKLSETAKLIIKRSSESGDQGLDLGKTPIPGARKELRLLTRAGFIVPLTENLFFSADIYKKMHDSIMRGLKPGDTFDIAHAKDRTGLSRKYIIPLLNRMEEKGFVAREDNLRRVKKIS